MKRFYLCVWSLLLMMGSAFSDELVGVSDVKRAEFNWTMHCRGCHQLDATGNQRGAPSMVGVVSLFLHKKEGREYLSRVPGVAFVSLPDNEVAELLNWMVQTFDLENVPKDFSPYTAKEVATLRQRPLISTATEIRETILRTLPKK